MGRSGRGAVEVIVADDRMTASVRVDPFSAPQGVEIGEVLAVLDAAGIDGVDDALVYAAVTDSGRIVTPEPLVVARGQPPQPAVAQRITLTRPESQWDAIAPGEPIGTLTEGRPGRDGRDVLGRRLVAPVTSDRRRVGTGIVVDEDGTLRAMVAGRVVLYPDGTLAVLTRQTVAGDFRPAPSKPPGTELPGDLEVTGSIFTPDGLDIAGSLLAGGTIEARRIECGQDLISRGGLLGAGLTEGRGRYVAARDLRCKFATACRIEAGRNVHIDSDLMHCKIQCAGQLTVHERIQGCLILATGGISCRSAGNSAQQVTVLEAGTDPVLRTMAAALLPSLEGPLQRVEHSRLTIAPLLARRHTLTPAQRQHAARLVEETNRLHREMTTQTALLRERYQRLQTEARELVLIEDTLAAQVVIRFPGLEATVPDALRGPLMIRPDHSHGEPRLVLTDTRSGAVSFLPARHLTDPVAVQLKRVMAKLVA